MHHVETDGLNRQYTGEEMAFDKTTLAFFSALWVWFFLHHTDIKTVESNCIFL
jgi:hypothetical protein